MIASLLLPLLLQSADALPACDQAAADKGIQQAMNQCAYRDYAIADAAMNAQWAITRAKAKQDDADFATSGSSEFDSREGHFASLLEAQRGWLRYRVHIAGWRVIPRAVAVWSRCSMPCARPVSPLSAPSSSRTLRRPLSDAPNPLACSQRIPSA